MAALPIVYTRFPRNEFADGDLYISGERGGFARQLTRLPGNELYAAWSPDGRRVAFTHSFANPNDPFDQNMLLAVVDADGQNVRTLTTAPMRSRHPAWSPDGSRIAFHYQDDGFTYGIAVVNADGSGLARLSGAREAAYTSPVWSAAGTHLTYERHGPRAGVWRVDVRDGSATQLDGTATCGAVPRPSPDQQQIAFVGQCEPYAMRTIFVANADGSGRRRLIDGVITQVAWAPDSRRLVFDRATAESRDVHWISADGGEPVPVAAGSGATEIFPDWRLRTP
jgi:TolB protein